MLCCVADEDTNMRRGGILIITPFKESRKFRDLLDKYAKPAWDQDEHFILLETPNHFLRDNNLLSKTAIRQGLTSKHQGINFRIFVCRQQDIPYSERRGENWQLEYCTSDFAFLKERIKEALGEFRLDWLSSIEATLSKYSHGNISYGSLKEWIQQFENLGNYRWIGENLLRSLDFWTEPRLAEALSLKKDEISGFQYICFNSHEFGKSGGVIQNLVQKKLSELRASEPLQPLPTLSDLRSCLEDNNTQNVLYVEDCLLSATESRSLLNSLLNKCPSGRNQKIPALSDSSSILGKNIQFRFAVHSEFGATVLREYLDSQGLSDCIEVSNTGEEIRVLTFEGEKSLASKNFWRREGETDVIACPEKYMRLPAFSNPKVWGTCEKEREKAVQFCKKVGYQLFYNYLKMKKDTASWGDWPNAKVRECALGMRSLGLSLAFAHSVPKASLPLFWAAGPVKVSGRPNRRNRTVTWVPLFRSAM